MTAPIEIMIDVDTLEKSSSGAISAYIWFVLSERAFPAEDWNDFAVVILTWWLTELASLEKQKIGLTRYLRFMDGPFSVRVLFDSNDEVEVECLERTAGASKTVLVGHCKTLEIRNAVLSAVGKILDGIEKREWETVETRRLRDARNLLVTSQQ